MTEQEPRVIDMSDPKQRKEYIASLFADYAQTSRLNMYLVMYSELRSAPAGFSTNEILQRFRQIRSAAKHFESAVWFDGGLQETVVQSSDRRFSMHDGDFSALVYTLAGRTMITLADQGADAEVTLITSEDEPRQEDGKGRMGVQSMDGKAQDIISVISKALNYQKQGTLKFEPDQKVSLGL